MSELTKKEAELEKIRHELKEILLHLEALKKRAGKAGLTESHDAIEKLINSFPLNQLVPSHVPNRR